MLASGLTGSAVPAAFGERDCSSFGYGVVMTASDRPPAAAKAESRRIILYFLVSLVALVIDFALLLLFTEVFGIHHLIANPISFTSGAVFAYVGSVLWIFDTRRFDNRSVEFIGFILIGLAGLLVNEGAIWLAKDLAGFALVPAKLFAAGCSFCFNYSARRIVLFS